MAQKTIFQLDLLSIASARTHASIVAIAIWALFIGLIIASINSPGFEGSLLSTILSFVMLGLVLWAVVAVVLLQIAMGTGIPTIVLTAIVTLLLALLVPLAVISQATTILKLSGAKPGFFGLNQTERDKITPGHCRGCGYNRAGLGLLDPCPECTRVPQVI